MAASQKVEGPILAAVGCLKLVPQAELPLILKLQSDNGLAQGTSVLADNTERGTFEEAEFLEESRDDEGVTEVKQQATEHQALMVQVGGVWTRADVAHRNLRADVEVAIYGQNWVVSVLNSLRKQSVAAALQEPFQQELGRGIQQGLLAVWGADILGRADWCGVFYFHEFRFDH